jgi:hypothetical protein
MVGRISIKAAGRDISPLFFPLVARGGLIIKGT